jgi:hypothetical protein
VQIPFALGPFDRIINVHWNTGDHLWSWLYVKITMGGQIAQRGGNWFFGVENGAYPNPARLRTTTKSKFGSPDHEPSVPPPPDLGSIFGDEDGFIVSGWPDQVDLDPAPTGFHGPIFAADTGATGSSGAYFVDGSTVYERNTSPFDFIDGPDFHQDYSGISVTNPTYPGITWRPTLAGTVRLFPDVSFDAILSPNQATF